jgi:chemotaxis protein methyltransferase CheR
VNEADFRFIRDFLKKRSGLSLPEEKRYLVQARLSPLARDCGFADIDALFAALRFGRDAGLQSKVVEAMTTNESFFFRDRIPFTLLEDVVLPRLIRARAATRRLRIWCAAAASGQEPYSIAMLLHRRRAELAGWRIELVATDISADMVSRIRAGRYSQSEVQRGLPVGLLLEHFKQDGDSWTIDQGLRAMVDSRTLNLMDDFSALGSFDIVFCRNVLIYFEHDTKIEVLNRVARQLAPDGCVVLGSAESVIGLTRALMPDPVNRGLYVPASPTMQIPA